MWTTANQREPALSRVLPWSRSQVPSRPKRPFGCGGSGRPVRPVRHESMESMVAPENVMTDWDHFVENARGDHDKYDQR